MGSLLPLLPSRRPMCEKEQGWEECGMRTSSHTWCVEFSFVVPSLLFHHDSLSFQFCAWEPARRTMLFRKGGRQRLKLWHSPGDSSFCPCFTLRHFCYRSSLEAGQGTWPLRNHTGLWLPLARRVPWQGGSSLSPLAEQLWLWVSAPPCPLPKSPAAATGYFLARDRKSVV